MLVAGHEYTRHNLTSYWLFYYYTEDFILVNINNERLTRYPTTQENILWAVNYGRKKRTSY